MRILYVTLENLSLHKGSVVHIKEVVNGLRKLGHHVGIAASSFGNYGNVDFFYNLNKISFSTLRLFRLKRQPYLISLFFLFLYLFRVLRQYDIIYARDYHTVIIALLPRLIFKKKLLLEINGLANEEQRLKGKTILNRILATVIKKAEKMATRCSNRIVSVTPQIATYLTQDFHCKADKVEVIGNGVNTEKFQPIYNEALLWSWRKRLGIAKEDIVVAFVGNLAPWQGVNILIESAFHLLIEIKQLKYLIVGDGILRSDFMKKVLDSGFEKEFIFTGMMDYENIPFLINLADICVAPFILRRNQKTGVSPLKVFEYMACGKPVISSRIEGVEFIETERTGLIVEPENPKNLEEASWALIKDPQKRMNMGQKGLKIARERFNWDSKMVNIEKILKELV